MKTPPKASAIENATLSIPQAARRLKITQKALRKKLGTGEMPFVEIRGELRVSLLSVEAAANDGETGFSDRMRKPPLSTQPRSEEPLHK
ncbi:MAG: helix-turn-helix domain-containing protein [Pirellulales bacterium]|nr:helix-turn-helix domain-containing protein [Pirellulales bacterium]